MEHALPLSSNTTAENVSMYSKFLNAEPEFNVCTEAAEINT